MNYASKRIDSQLRAMLVAESLWATRTSSISPSPGFEPANPSTMQRGSAELGSLPKRDGKSEIERKQEGIVDHPETQGGWHGLQDVGRPGDRGPPLWPGGSQFGRTDDT